MGRRTGGGVGRTALPGAVWLVVLLLLAVGCDGSASDEPASGRVTLAPTATPTERPPEAAATVDPPALTAPPPTSPAPTATLAPEVAPVWGQWAGNAYRTWQSAAVAPGEAPEVRWTLDLPEAVAAEPLVLGDGSARVALEGGTLLALDADGGEQWRFEAGGDPLAPALGPEGRTYLVVGRGVQGQVVAVSAAGEPLWQHTLEYGSAEPPLVDGEGNLYLVSYLGEVISLSAEGDERWRWKSETGTAGHLVMDAGGTLYAGPILTWQTFGHATAVWALDASGGTEVWWLRDGGVPRIDSAGQAYFTGESQFRAVLEEGVPVRQAMGEEEAQGVYEPRVYPARGSFDPEAEANPILMEMTRDAEGLYVALLIQMPVEGSPGPDDVLELVAYDLAAHEIVWRRDTGVDAAGVQPFQPTPDERRAFTAPVVGPGGRIYLGDRTRLTVYRP
jgi:hypothetical protein